MVKVRIDVTPFSLLGSQGPGFAWPRRLLIPVRDRVGAASRAAWEDRTASSMERKRIPRAGNDRPAAFA